MFLSLERSFLGFESLHRKKFGIHLPADHILSMYNSKIVISCSLWKIYLAIYFIFTWNHMT